MSEQERLLRLTFALARDARKNGNHPFGALLVLDGAIVLRAENQVVSESDPTRHAELALVSQAGRELSRAELEWATLYASTEPCAMCASAIYWSGIGSVVYGCPAEDLARLAQESHVFPCREILGRGDRAIAVIGPLLREEALAVHDGFWS